MSNYFSKFLNAIAASAIASLTQLFRRSRHSLVHRRNALNVVLLPSTKLCCTNSEKISTIGISPNVGLVCESNGTKKSGNAYQLSSL
ncbi:hypothetical protein [Nostoc sp. NMS2]|uniref:hypothetical protein n=1 Tax=Nostoc sp. NMS2 TaxID=2815389 RepID=UPI002600C704|nr:hypothetical protein [Nostoc sp. NMS2]